MRVERRFLMIEKDYSHHFELVSNYEPAGDQPKAIQELTEGVKKNKKAETDLASTFLSFYSSFLRKNPQMTFFQKINRHKFTKTWSNFG